MFREGLATGAHLLKQSFGLASRVIRAKVLVFLHLLLNGEKLALELVAQPRQGVTDVVGQLLHKRKVEDDNNHPEVYWKEFATSTPQNKRGMLLSSVLNPSEWS